MIEFDWDAANRRHLAEHSVTPAEFEQALYDSEDLHFDVLGGEDRYHSVGLTDSGRLLFLAWTIRGEKIRAVTAFDAPQSVLKEWKKKR